MVICSLEYMPLELKDFGISPQSFTDDDCWLDDEPQEKPQKKSIESTEPRPKTKRIIVRTPEPAVYQESDFMEMI